MCDVMSNAGRCGGRLSHLRLLRKAGACLVSRLYLEVEKRTCRAAGELGRGLQHVPSQGI